MTESVEIFRGSTLHLMQIQIHADSNRARRSSFWEPRKEDMAWTMTASAACIGLVGANPRARA